MSKVRTGMFAALGFVLGVAPTLPGGAVGKGMDLPNLAPRKNRVRGAASEPEYTPATFNSTGDAKCLRTMIRRGVIVMAI
jgi:hypothetical protein